MDTSAIPGRSCGSGAAKLSSSSAIELVWKMSPDGRAAASQPAYSERISDS
jgi:hypothetical protein